MFATLAEMLSEELKVNAFGLEKVPTQTKLVVATGLELASTTLRKAGLALNVTVVAKAGRLRPSRLMKTDPKLLVINA
jgi:hypothetical protein